MSFDTPDDPHSRDTRLARLLAEALRSRSKDAAGLETSACPDAEVLATYADHGLAEEETPHWESHFADCDRCQKIIAVLAASGEKLTESEVERLGSLAAAASASRQPVARKAAKPWKMIWRRPALWRWLVPAAGLASAALWFALRQPPPRQALSSQKTAATNGAPQSEASGSTAVSAKADETQIAQANLPAPPAAPPPGALPRDRETVPTKSSDAARQEPKSKQESVRSAAQEPMVSEADNALEAREDTAKDNRFPSSQPVDKKSQIVDALGAAPPVASPAAPSTPPPAREGERAVRQELDRATGAPVPAQLKPLTLTASPAIVFASPNRRALWRLGSGGRIERSTDQGQTWQPQTSGVTADLLAGAAPSEKIAWVVGRAGTIVHTEDGEHWQRVAPPPAIKAATAQSPAPDWLGVEARDTLHATIISRDLRRFVTEDGGRTWVQEK
ncbi:MAG: hypothetical protein DMG30_22290 [Acidobacteria bacterium]|nr:MAG: hypothetical protein DMG30_22290 [Acidobacteriota bacterium]